MHAIDTTLTDSIFKSSGLDKCKALQYWLYMTKLSKEAMREYMRKRRAGSGSEDNPIKHPDVIPAEYKAKEIDPKIWAYAVVRAERAKRYALKMPEFIRTSDLVFQDPAWQYERELRYAREFTH